MKKLFLGIFCFLGVLGSYADEAPLWLRHSTLSPDGKTIAFTYQGDIFTVPVTGGQAKQITTDPAYDTRPVWSLDGSLLAFSSDREGSFDVYIVGREGGIPKRITFNSAHEHPELFLDDEHLLFSSNQLPDVKFGQFPSGVFKPIYKVNLKGERPSLYSSITMENLSMNHGRILYTDVKGYEDPLRKHHTSSVTRDIWLVDKNKYTKLSTFVGENRNPVWASNGQDYYYLSEENGSFNVYKADIHGGKSQQLTHFKDHPVRFLSGDKQDNLCFSYDGQIYFMKQGGSPELVKINIRKDNTVRDESYRTLRSGATSMAIAPNGKEIAFVARGDVYVTHVEYATTKRITNTPEQERTVDFAPDGRSIVYASERNGAWNIYKTELVRKEDLYFCYAHELKETQLTKTESPSFEPAFSPDGEEIAYLENRSGINVLNLKSGKIRQVMDPKFNYSYSDGDQHFRWSPDGQWILTDYIGIGGWNNKDVALIKADGSGTIVNLTESGYSDTNGEWVLDGKAIMWYSDRAGYRSHGSWGAEYDIYLMFLDQKEYEKFGLSKEELALEEEIEKKQKEEKEKAEKKKDKKKSKKEDSKEDTKKEAKKNILKLQFEDRDWRVRRLTRNSSNLSSALMTKKGDKLYYLVRFEKDYDLWEHDFKENTTKLLSKGVGGGVLMQDKEGKEIYLLSRGAIKKITDGKVKPVSFEAPFHYKASSEREYIYDHAWKQVKDKFYDKNIHGVDWDMYRDAYRKFLPHINNNYDFADLLSELLGELNASHTGASFFKGNGARKTAVLGAFFDETYKGDGLKIAEVLKGGPLDKSGDFIKPGVIIEAIDGEMIKAGENYSRLLEDKAGKNVSLTLYQSEEGKRVEKVVKPIDQGAQNGLLYERWVNQRKEMTERYSNGRLGYIHIQGMNSWSFRRTYKELLGKYRHKEAIIIDTRFNGGGWLHDDLATLLSGKEYQQFAPRGQYIGSDPFNKWNKPSILLMGESNYSNAHGFPWVYKHLKIGKLVGAPVPGTMTAVWWEAQIDPSIVFGIPQVTVVDMEGKAMENVQLEPDIKVYNTPESLIEGDDLQLKRAIDELLKDLGK